MSTWRFPGSDKFSYKIVADSPTRRSNQAQKIHRMPAIDRKKKFGAEGKQVGW
jgi:hypothetical protein